MNHIKVGKTMGVLIICAFDSLSTVTTGDKDKSLARSLAFGIH